MNLQVNPYRDLGLEFCREAPHWFRADRPKNKAFSRIDALLFRHWTRHTADELASKIAEAKSVPESLRAVAAHVRSLVAMRRVGSEVSLDSASTTEFRNSRYARLVFGHTNCEGGADIARQLLRRLGYAARLVETVGGYQHTVVFVSTAEGWAFVDPYSDFPVYWVDGFRPSKAFRRRRFRRLAALDGVPEYNSFGFPDGAVREHGLYPAAPWRAEVADERPERWRLLPSLAAARRKLEKLPPAPRSPFLSDYLSVRDAHVWSGVADPGRYLELVERHRLDEYRRSLVEHFGQVPT